jgi:hypothetical protein
VPPSSSDHLVHLAPAFAGSYTLERLSDPPEQRSEEFIRAQVACVQDAEFPLVEIDGIPVENPDRYLEQSIVFEVILPEDNLFGATEEDIPELTLSPSVDQGFYLLLTPRTPGTHTIRWQARSASCRKPLRSARPLLHSEARDSREFADIAGNEGQPVGHRDAGDNKVALADRLGPQGKTQVGMPLGGLVVEGQSGQRSEKGGDGLPGSRRIPAPPSAVP